MKKSFMLVWCLMALFIFVSVAQAETGCLLHVKRTAASDDPAIVKECYKKCPDGKPECDQLVPEAKDAAACKEAAKKECEIKRPEVTKAKKVTAKFDGKALDDGKDFCGK